MATEYKQQSDDWSLILQEANTKFATSTGNLNTAEEAIRLKVDEANTSPATSVSPFRVLYQIRVLWRVRLRP